MTKLDQVMEKVRQLPQQRQDEIAEVVERTALEAFIKKGLDSGKPIAMEKEEMRNWIEGLIKNKDDVSP